ncbi:MAG: M23 family metallopeptidase, partial [Anaerolineales bacterium]|nr:M23 family metallopeptidase [Anaerolineales bacterium]
MGAFRFEAWPTEFQKITQYFGANPQNYAQFGLPGHEGIDIRAPTGSRVFAVAAGEVFRVHTDASSHNYGIHIRIQHQDDYKTVYGHLESVNVREGQIVEAGQMIGYADNTGNSFGSHLHLTLKKIGVHYPPWPREIIDPLPFLLPLLGWEEPAGPYIEGWIMTAALTRNGNLAQVNAGGATLRVTQDYSAEVPSGTIVIVTGEHPTFTKVKASRAAVGINDTPPPTTSEPPPTAALVRGWAWEAYVTVAGQMGIAGPHGINLRDKPSRDAHNIGLVRAGSTVLLDGEAQNNYLPVKAKRSDFMEPVALTELPPEPGVGPETGQLGWVLHRYLDIRDRLAVVSRYGVNLRSKPDPEGSNVGLVKSSATVRIVGQTEGDYLPIMANLDDVL